MEPLENVNKLYDNFEVHELSSETPVGWSSICLDQTINYYIDYHSTHHQEEENLNHLDKTI